jgi:hypothetical protein
MEWPADVISIEVDKTYSFILTVAERRKYKAKYNA